MRHLVVMLFTLFIFTACGKDNKTSEKSLELNQMMSTGVNFGTVTDRYGQKFIVVTCESTNAAGNYNYQNQGLNQARIQSLQNFFQSNNHEYYTIIGERVSRSVMQQLVNTAIVSLQYSYDCPAQIIAYTPAY